MKPGHVKNWYWLLGLAAACLPLFVLGAFPGHQKEDLAWTTVQRRSFDIRVNAIGELDAERAHLISSGLRGDTGKLIFLVEDGAWVERGEVLVRFDPSPLEEEILTLEGEASVQSAGVEAAEQALEWEKSQVERELKAAQYEVVAARLDLKKLRHGEGPLQLAQLQLEVEEARDKFLRHQSFAEELDNLRQQGFSSDREIAQAKKKVVQLEKTLLIAEKKLASYRDYVFPAEVENAEANLKRLEMELGQGRREGAFKVGKALAAVKKNRQKMDNTLKKLAVKKVELEKTVLRAPSSGIVILSQGYFGSEKRKPRVGDAVWQNRPILYLPDISSFVVKTKVREIDLHKVEKGQPVDIQVDAYPDAPLLGRVLSIGALAETSMASGQEKSFQLVVGVEGADERLRPGMTARVSILNKRLENVVVVPLQALHPSGERFACYRVEGERLVWVAVEPGAHNEDFVEIREGLKEGDRVSLLGPADLP